MENAANATTTETPALTISDEEKQKLISFFSLLIEIDQRQKKKAGTS